MTSITHCSLCGHRGELNFADKTAVRDNYRCANCRGMQRQRDLAQVVLDEFACGLASSFQEAVEKKLLDQLSIYEVGMQGPFGPRLKRLPHYTRSYFWDDVLPGDTKNGIRCEDLRKLTFADHSFDLIFSAEVLEHVFDLPTVLTEIHRVLKPGGSHIFSIPNKYPFPTSSADRAILVDGQIRYIEPEYYHVAGDGSKSLVVTDFGSDLIELHRKAGLRLSIIRRSAPLVPQLQNATFLARRPR